MPTVMLYTLPCGDCELSVFNKHGARAHLTDVGGHLDPEAELLWDIVHTASRRELVREGRYEMQEQLFFERRPDP